MGPRNLPAVQVWTGKMVRFASGPVQKPNPPLLGGFVTWTGYKPAVFWRVLHTVEPHFRELRTLAPIKYLGSDSITI